MNTVTLTLPAFWASYLINGDATGLDDAEQAAVDSWLVDQIADIAGFNPNCLSCSDYAEFTAAHDAIGYALPCECLEFIFPIAEGAL